MREFPGIMKRFFPTSLALLLIIGSFGHAFAATLCAQMVGADCCAAMQSRHSPVTAHSQPVDLSFESNEEDVSTAECERSHRATTETTIIPTAGLMVDNLSSGGSQAEIIDAAKVDMPPDGCSLCARHLDDKNAPALSSNLLNESKGDKSPAITAAFRFVSRSGLTVAQIDLPSENAPPINATRRHILINVFLI